MSLLDVNWIKKKCCVPKYGRHDSDGSGMWKELKKISYHAEYYIATSRAREAEEDEQRSEWTT